MSARRVWASRPGHLADVLTQFVSSLLGRGCYMALQVVLARGLGPERFGLYAIGWTVAGLAGTLAPIGMPQAMLRYTIGGRRSLRSRPMLVVLLAGLAVMAVLLSSAGVLATRVFGAPAAAPLIEAFAPSVPLLCLFGVTSSALRASGRMLASAITGTALFVIYFGLTLLAFAAHPSAIAAVHLYTLSIALMLAANLLLLWRAPATAAAAPPVRVLVHFGIVTMFIHSSSVLNIWADRVVIGVMATPALLASYQVASQLAMIMVVLRSAVNIVFEARVPKHQVGAPLPDVSREFLAATRLLLHISVPGLVVLACTSTFWVRLLFGPAYASAALPLVVLIAGQVAATFCGPSVTALHMTGAERTVMALMFASCLLNIAGCLALIPALGATGAALATSAAIFLVGLACLVWLMRTGRLRFGFANLRDIAAATVLCVVGSIVLTRLIGPLSIVSAIAVTAVTYALYAAVICSACTVEDEAVALVRPMLRRPFRRLAP